MNRCRCKKQQQPQHRNCLRGSPITDRREHTEVSLVDPDESKDALQHVSRPLLPVWWQLHPRLVVAHKPYNLQSRPCQTMHGHSCTPTWFV